MCLAYRYMPFNLHFIKRGIYPARFVIEKRNGYTEILAGPGFQEKLIFSHSVRIGRDHGRVNQ
ncbi:MAG: hypothetical protein APR53_10475 [Methanoculleus sp. SDB]|nr:MAG: hypothetical protein APR53_10475 [Methanoculleus sp. SDB]